MAKKVIEKNQRLNKEQLAILAACIKNIFAFSLHVKVVNPVKGVVPFNLYPFQRSTLLEFMKNRFNIVLKFRQAGITELISMYCLWLAMFHPNKKIIIISIKDNVAKKVLKKIKFMYKNLPWFLQTPIINGRAGEMGSSTLMEFSNGSTIESIPTSEQAGRSEAVSLLVIDEAAMVRWAATIAASAIPTLSTGGQFIANSCVTGDTKIIGRKGNFRVEQICPKEVGYQDVRFMDLYVLTHKLKWRKVLYGVNKGNLETWRLQTESSNEIKCTPAHKFLTPYGWKSAEYCIKHNLPVITYESGLASLEDPPITTPPRQEVMVPVPGFENYLITTHGRILYKDTLKPKKPMSNKDGYYRVKLWNRNQRKNFTLSKLMAETFLGPIPQGYVVDHINCIKTDNYITNLQIISTSENSKRATKYNRNLVLNNNTGAGAPDIRLVGYIKYKFLQGLSPDSIIKRVKRWFNKDINRAYISRIVNGHRCTGIQLSKLRLLEKYSDIIYDLTVEGDESYITPNGFISHNTPLGIGNWYHSQWVDAINDLNGFNPIRLYWNMHPERDDGWYNEMARALGPKRTAQEIDGDFLSSGNMVFEASDIKAIEEDLYEYPTIKKRLNGQFLQFLEPEKDMDYYIGADISTGRATDYSSFTCMDDSGEEYAVFKGKIPINKFSRLLGDIGEVFNYAKLAPETNDIGMATTMFLQDEGYPNLYHHRKFLKKKGSRKKEIELIPGWITTGKNRSMIIEGLEKDIREEEVIIKDPFFVQEAYTFIYDGQGRPVAMGKHKSKNSSVDIDLEGETYADDSIFGKAITNHIRKYSKIESTTVMPQ